MTATPSPPSPPDLPHPLRDAIAGLETLLARTKDGQARGLLALAIERMEAEIAADAQAQTDMTAYLAEQQRTWNKAQELAELLDVRKGTRLPELLDKAHATLVTLLDLATDGGRP